MQANAAEMLRLACIYGTRAGIRVCAPVHDAVLIEAPIAELDAAIDEMQDHMAAASAGVLGGPKLESNVVRIRYPDRFMDPRGKEMWGVVMSLLDGKGGAERSATRSALTHPSNLLFGLINTYETRL